MTTLFSLIVILAVGYLIVKRYNPQTTLFLGGMLLMVASVFFGTVSHLQVASWLSRIDIFTFVGKQ